ncbi:MAG: alkaline phosphatase family protein [Coleofasciculus sp. G1-WW12-02]|uniref:alkaline phosphatase family protein n=1 Tax=Coleofasciculus sp. G1-WW12-02 TaxID=3068483 RepID=UPI0032F1F887
MKMLVIGIDGGDQKILKSMNMPNLKAILNEQICLDTEEDLWSRGWAEILSGIHGRETGAFYSKPKLEGSHDFSKSFSTNDYNNNDLIVPLWTKLLKLGHKVGFMNVPTTMPAPDVDGFFIAGASGGSKVSGASNIPAGVCFPRESLNDLIQHQYILDTRFISSGIRDVETFFNRLVAMQTNRTNAFIQLSQKYQPNFGFLAYRATTVVQYIVMSEIEFLMANPDSPQTKIQKRIHELYQGLDQCIYNLLEQLQPEYIIVVSDHGASPRLATVNMNVFLQEIDMQKPLPSSVKTTRRLVKQFAQLVPRQVRRSITQSVPQVRSISQPAIDWSQTRAFGARYVSGVYINDRERFAGTVCKSEVDQVTQQIIEAFNATEAATKHGLYARPYRQNYRSAKFADLLPDIWIDNPDSIFFEEKGQFVEENKDYKPIESLSQVTRDQYTGAKGRHPLLCINPELYRYVEDGDPWDLTLVYKIIERAMAQ